MTCEKCGNINNEGAKFCVKCGNALSSAPLNNINTPLINNNQYTDEVNNKNITNQAPIQNNENNISADIQSNISNQTNIKPSLSLNFFKYIGLALIKPIKTFKDEEEKLSETKNSFILAGIVAVTMMLIGLINSVINTIFVETYDYQTYDFKTTIDFSYLENLDYITLIFKNLLIYAAIILGITAVYYIGSLIVKKTISFTKTLYITATAVLPYVALGMLVSPILGKIWEPLSIITMVGGAVYSILIFFSLIKNEISLNNPDLDVYFHLACMTILGTAGYYIFINFLTSGISSEINDFLNIFS